MIIRDDSCGPDCIGVPCCTNWSRWSDCPCGGYWDHADCPQREDNDDDMQDDGRLHIVSLFSGIGGLDLACERAFGGVTVAQVERDPYCLRVLERHWPEAARHDDVTAYAGQSCDVVCGGFPCQDLSIAGKRAGLDGERSGLYHEMMRVVAASEPTYVVIENVPPLLKYRSRVEADLERMGYGSVWQVCEASDVGAPHRRQRVFIVAVRGLPGSRMLPRPSPQGDLFAPAFGGDGSEPGRQWPTPAAADGSGSRSGGVGTSETGRRPDGTKATIGLQAAARAWPTPLATDAKGPKGAGMVARGGGERLSNAVASWPTPTLCGNDNRKGASKTSGDGLATAVKAWPTPIAHDAKDSGRAPSERERSKGHLPTIVVEDSADPVGVLNPAWVDLLMGLPSGWTQLDGDLVPHVWPAGRGEQQHPSEPPRLVPPKVTPHRRERLKALGNAVVWQQAHAAIVRALEVAGRRTMATDAMQGSR